MERVMERILERTLERVLERILERILLDPTKVSMLSFYQKSIVKSVCHHILSKHLNQLSLFISIVEFGFIWIFAWFILRCWHFGSNMFALLD